MDREERMKRTPEKEQNPKVRVHNFEEVCQGYDIEKAVHEASRCLDCKVPGCVKECPVSINIPKFIEKVVAGEIEEAAKIIAQSSALPAVCGRVCSQETQCEGNCVLGIKGEPVAIGKLEKFVADYCRNKGIKIKNKIEKNGKKVAIVGSGPAGLACGGDLAKLGYDVTIFESLHEAGGVLTYGIPEFRLPKKEVVQSEIKNVLDLGVKIQTDTLVGRTITIDDLLEKEGFSAIFVGSGAGLPRFMGIKGENANGVFSANEFLTRCNLMKGLEDKYDTPINIPKKLAVIGAGNVAMDAARTAARLGCEVHIIYRRGEEEIPARREEAHHAKQEGIIFNLLTNPTEIMVDENGWTKGLKCVRMELGEADESGRRRPHAIEGSDFEIEVDSVIMALGTSPNPLLYSTTKGLETNKWGCLVIDEETCMTTKKAVFAGGDAVTGAATVILAMGAGKKAAVEIDKYIKNN